MIGLYAGMLLIGIGSALCLWQAVAQWFKGEALAESAPETQTRDVLRRCSDKEEKRRAYALGCLVASAALALVDIIVGGIVAACGG